MNSIRIEVFFAEFNQWSGFHHCILVITHGEGLGHGKDPASHWQHLSEVGQQPRPRLSASHVHHHHEPNKLIWCAPSWSNCGTRSPSTSMWLAATSPCRALVVTSALTFVMRLASWTFLLWHFRSECPATCVPTGWWEVPIETTSLRILLHLQETRWGGVHDLSQKCQQACWSVRFGSLWWNFHHCNSLPAPPEVSACRTNEIAAPTWRSCRLGELSHGCHLRSHRRSDNFLHRSTIPPITAPTYAWKGKLHSYQCASSPLNTGGLPLYPVYMVAAVIPRICPGSTPPLQYHCGMMCDHICCDSQTNSETTQGSLNQSQQLCNESEDGWASHQHHECTTGVQKNRKTQLNEECTQLTVQQFRLNMKHFSSIDLQSMESVQRTES